MKTPLAPRGVGGRGHGHVGPEQRAAPRLDVRLRVVLTFDDPKPAMTVHTANVSKGGMFVVYRHPAPIGTMVRFRIAINELNPLIGTVHGTGHVVWIRLKTLDLDEPNGMAIEFLHLADDGRERLAAAIEAAGGSAEPSQAGGGSTPSSSTDP